MTEETPRGADSAPEPAAGATSADAPDASEPAPATPSSSASTKRDLEDTPTDVEPPGEAGQPSDARQDATPAAAATPGRGRAGLVVGALALIVALAAVVAAAFGWWRQVGVRAQLGSAQAALADARTAVESGLGAVQGLSGELEATRSELDQVNAAQARLEDRVNELLGDVEETNRSLQRVERAVTDAGGLLSSARETWVLAETEYLLQTANAALQLGRDPSAALAALLAADDRLQALSDPALTRVRARLSEEITALRAMPRPDLQGVALTLASLAARVELLPLAGGPSERYGEEEAAVPEEKSGLDRALAALGGAIKGLVSIERDEADIEALLAPEERFFLYRNLELQLEAARVAALRGDAANYRESLASARRWLQSHFATESPGVLSALDTLAELETVDVSPEPPDISGSLTLLRRADADTR